MFTAAHFAWIGISLAVAVLFYVWSRKQAEKTVLSVMCAVAVTSEVVKIFCMMEPVDQGVVIDPGILPFHLCAIQIFLIFVLRLSRSEKVKEFVYAFSYPAAIVGAFLALLIPTEGTSFAEVHPYQYFLYHALLVSFGFWIYHTRRHIFTKKSVLQALIGLLCSAWLAFYMNALTGENFMFLTRAPMEDLPYLNMDHGWYVYFAHLLCAAAAGLMLPYLPVLLGSRKGKKRQ